MKPSRVFLFIAGVLVCLAVLCVVLPHRVEVGSRTLRWPTLAEVTGTEFPNMRMTDSDTTDLFVSLDTLGALVALNTIPEIGEEQDVPDKPTEKETQVRSEKPAAPPVETDSASDPRRFLHTFYASLEESSSRAVRVMHYGDSQIEEDRMTQQLREALQNKYGGSGAGLLPLAQTIPSRTVRQELFMNGRRVSPQQGPRRYMVHGMKRDQRADGLYGPMGQMAVLNDSLVRGSEDITAVCTPLDGRPRYTRWLVFADDSIDYTFAGDSVYLQGRGAVYGLSQQSSTGVIVDNIPMRGCLGLVFTKISSAQLRRFYREQNVKLIILQFGGNAIPFNENPGTIAAIVSGLRDQVRYLKNCAPEASFLFIGPSDMCRQVDGEWQSYPMVGYMDRLLRKMANEEEIAYFSLYGWMGGSGSMLRWQEIGFAGNDGVHFTRSGARRAGNAVVSWLLGPVEN